MRVIVIGMPAIIIAAGIAVIQLAGSEALGVTMILAGTLHTWASAVLTGIVTKQPGRLGSW